MPDPGWNLGALELLLEDETGESAVSSLPVSPSLTLLYSVALRGKLSRARDPRRLIAAARMTGQREVRDDLRVYRVCSSTAWSENPVFKNERTKRVEATSGCGLAPIPVS